MAMIQRRQIDMVNRRRVEKDVLSVGAKIEVVMMFYDCGWQTIPDIWGGEMRKARAAVAVLVDVGRGG